MNYSFSSDDEVACGPLTLREIKHELKKEPAKITRRLSDSEVTTYFTPFTSLLAESEGSKYETPNESLFHPPTANSEFLSNLAKVIQGDDELQRNDVEDTLINILNRDGNEHCSILDNVRQTLYENITEVSDDNLSTSQSCIEDSEGDVIVISDESTDSIQPILCEAFSAQVKVEESDICEDSLNSISTKLSDTSDVEDSITSTEQFCNENEKSKSHSNSIGTEDEEVSNAPEVHHSSEEIEDDLENKLENMNSSHPVCTTSDLSFNDTLEEIERALREGLDYLMPEDVPSTSTEHSTPKMHEPPESKIPKLKKKLTPNKFDYVESPVAEYIRRKSPENFKVPLKPPVKTPLPQRLRAHKQLKNIISPVGIYIKNSPGGCLKQNVAIKNAKLLKVQTKSEVPQSNKENDVLPEVVYRPAKHVIKSVEDIKLPGSIQKMVPKPTITIHQKRINKNLNKSVISRKLLEDNLTVGSSILDESDVSFHNVKEAFIK